jgi:hypothetical protein
VAAREQIIAERVGNAPLVPPNTYPRWSGSPVPNASAVAGIAKTTDGELMRERIPLVYAIQPRALRLLVPSAALD